MYKRQQLYFTGKRDKIPSLSLDASYMIQPKTGYIRINRFGATTADEFAEDLKSLACYLNEQPYACSKYIEMKCQERCV